MKKYYNAFKEFRNLYKYYEFYYNQALYEELSDWLKENSKDYHIEQDKFDGSRILVSILRFDVKKFEEEIVSKNSEFLIF